MGDNTSDNTSGNLSNNHADPSSPPGPSLSVGQRLAIVSEHLDALAGLCPRELASAEALDVFDAAFEASDRLHALAAQTLPSIEADGLWAIDGARTFPAWVSRRIHVTYPPPAG